MAEDNNDCRKKYKELLEEMMKELNGGRKLDKVAINSLKATKNSLLHCGRQDARTGKWKRLIDE